MFRIVRLRLGRIVGEPSTIEAIRIVFVGTEEMPVAVPDLHPSVVAPAVSQQRSADGARRNPDRAAGVHQDDREPGASGATGLDRFTGALVRRFAAGVVVDVDQLEKLAVENLRGFACRLRVLHEWSSSFKEIRPPGLPGFIEDGVGQHVVEEDFLGDLIRPRELGAGIEREV